MQDSFLTVAEVAELLKINPQTIRNWIDSGQLPGVRVGARRVRVRQSDLDRFIEAGATVVPSADQESADANQTEAVGSELREQLAAALEDTHSKVADGNDTELVVALNALAEVASRLAPA